ncbi:MAG: response regulator transcription factor [Actinomycetota bacterium]|nr:response regulator transcription factor [Actinomycetota bacterium]
MRSVRVLIVEDDEDLAAAVGLELDHAGYEVRVEPDGPGALRVEPQWGPDLVVLDLGLPTLDGVEVCRRLRAKSVAPILIVTARDGIEQRVRGLDAGADDYVVKPFSLEELSARVRALLRRSRMREEGQRLRLADLVLDATARTVRRGRHSIELTRREFDLLEFFMRHPGQALERSTILSEVWGFDFLGGSNVVDVYVGYLRQKLGGGDASRLIETVRGVGYRLGDGQ